MATPVDMKALKQAFEHFDKNGDGTISIEELADVMKSCGKKPSKQELEDMINNVDLDGDKVVNFQEFVKMMDYETTSTDDDAEMRHIFAIFDKNGDGHISRSELKAAMKRLNEKFSDTEMDQIIAEADMDGDGEVNFKEFKILCLNKKF